MNHDVEVPDPVSTPDRTRDDKWYGVPPKGERPLPGKWRYVAEIFCVILFEFVLWGIYRYFSAPYISPFGTLKFYTAHVIAAPIIHLIPIVLYWRYFRKERGHPFTFTRTRIMSGVAIGLLSAVLWRVLEMFSDDFFITVAGGRVFGTLGFYSHLDTTTVLLFAVMTFTHFFIVGPVEELEFRSFTHDQAARVLPNWQALVFSSVLFGLSHVPIALTVYRMPLHHLIVAEIGWMSAGAVFGALYMWSRNIWACIIMHGMGNWQLSVFGISSSATAGGMGTMTSIFVGSISQLLVNAIMILIFYLVFRYYWEPQRMAEESGKGPTASLLDRIRPYDYGRRPIGNTSMKLTVFCVGVCAIIMLGTFTVGDTAFVSVSSYSYSSRSGVVDISSLEVVEDQLGDIGYLVELETETITINCQEGRYVKAVHATVSWTDEDDFRQVRLYENQPDTFSVLVTGPNASGTDQGANPRNGEGSISAGVDFSDEELEELLVDGNYSVEVVICLENVGNYEARAGIGVGGYVDDGNEYVYDIMITWLEGPI